MFAQIQGFGRQFIIELIKYQHSQIPEKTFNMLCAMIIANTLNFKSCATHEKY